MLKKRNHKRVTFFLCICNEGKFESRVSAFLSGLSVFVC